MTFLQATRRAMQLALVGAALTVVASGVCRADAPQPWRALSNS